MSIESEILRIRAAKAAIKSSIEAKGVAVPEDASIGAFAALIDSIPYQPTE